MLKASDVNSFCGDMSIQLCDVIWGASRTDLAEWFGGRHAVFLHKARVGIDWICQLLGLGPGDEVLIPAYNCGSEVDPFVKNHLRVIFYRVDVEGRIDCRDIQSRVTDRTKLVYVTHYFGWPQDIKKLSEYCRRSNLYLIEDCALSLFSNPVGFPIGTFGDAVVYSFPKTLPVPDGGVVTFSERLGNVQCETQEPATALILRSMLPIVKRAVLRGFEEMGAYRIVPRRLKESWRRHEEKVSFTASGLPEMPSCYYFNSAISCLRISRVSRYLLGQAYPESVVMRRRNNYLAMYSIVEKSEIFRPLYREMPEGACPLCLPVVVEDRAAACVRLRQKDIAAIPWWAGFHRDFDWNEFPEARYLKEHVLSIPVHQQLTAKNIRHMSKAIKDCTSEISRM